MKYLISILAFLPLCVALLLSPRVLACASCGSGGDDPLILYPNEVWKFYSGYTYTGGYKNIDHKGSIGESLGPHHKNQLLLSVGRRASHRLFFTTLMPYISNHAHGRRDAGFGDPLVSSRYTLVQQDISQALLPQIQLLASYKKGISRSIHQSRDENQLDVFGNGFDQIRLGIDLWSGLTQVQYGIAQVYGFSQAKTIDDHTITPGVESRTTVSIGSTFDGFAKMILGINRYYVGPLKDDGKRIEQSDQLNYSLFLTADLYLQNQDAIRATVTKQAAFLTNRNTTQSHGTTIAYMRAF